MNNEMHELDPAARNALLAYGIDSKEKARAYLYKNGTFKRLPNIGDGRCRKIEEWVGISENDVAEIDAANKLKMQLSKIVAMIENECSAISGEVEIKFNTKHGAMSVVTQKFGKCRYGGI